VVANLKHFIMGKFKHFIGIDVSKEYFDAVIILHGKKEATTHSQFPNSYKGIKSFCKWVKTVGALPQETLVCLEHTGIYGRLIIKYLTAFKFHLWVEMAIRIQRSNGVQRGKNDKIDAERIALYAFKNQETARIYEVPSELIDKIRALLTLREKLTKSKVALKKTSNEMKHFQGSVCLLVEKHQKNTLKAIKSDLKCIEIELNAYIKEDENIKKIYSQTTSVKGVGKITALYLICFTNQFKMYSTPRQLACYVGVAPFEHSSGKSIRGKSKVHFMANKKLKKQLHMCAMSAIVHDLELKEYYQRKVDEGKNKMLVINNVRNKLVHRICSCIRNDRKFEEKKAA
jgi:transposase